MIREGCVEDLPDIMGLIQEAIIDMESKGIYQWDNSYPNKEIISGDIDGRNLYVYENDGVIQGIIVLNEEQDEAYKNIQWEFNTGSQLVIHRVCIAPQYQGKGIAKVLMGFAQQKGKESGYEAIRLDTFENNDSACNLYKKLGYIDVGTVRFSKGKFYCFEKPLNY